MTVCSDNLAQVVGPSLAAILAPHDENAYHLMLCLGIPLGHRIGEMQSKDLPGFTVGPSASCNLSPLECKCRSALLRVFFTRTFLFQFSIDLQYQNAEYLCLSCEPEVRVDLHAWNGEVCLAVNQNDEERKLGLTGNSVLSCFPQKVLTASASDGDSHTSLLQPNSFRVGHPPSSLPWLQTTFSAPGLFSHSCTSKMLDIFQSNVHSASSPHPLI